VVGWGFLVGLFLFAGRGLALGFGDLGFWEAVRGFWAAARGFEKAPWDFWPVLFCF